MRIRSDIALMAHRLRAMTRNYIKQDRNHRDCGDDLQQIYEWVLYSIGLKKPANSGFLQPVKLMPTPAHPGEGLWRTVEQHIIEFSKIPAAGFVHRTTRQNDRVTRELNA